WDIARAYEVSMDEIVAANRLADPSRLQVGQQLIIPGAQAQAAALRREALVSSSGQLLRNFDWPLTGRISSRFGPRWGRMHQGLDIAVPTGTPVRAAAAGTVTYAGAMGGYGNIVTIDHGNRVETRYAHNSRIVVRVGQRVKRGEVIAYSGNTGNSTGPHLHFEIRYRGTPVNPEHYLKR
ncbi:MAG: peptidoglycan DD-metalloendopeptidase family protein, partial [Limnochordales bacterium]